MKKLLVVLLAFAFVVAISTVALAVATTSVDGKVEWTFTSGDQFGGTDDGKIILDLGKDFGEGYTAGLKIKLSPNENDDVLDTSVPPVAIGVDKASSVAYDGNGWIQMVKDMYTVKFQTGGLGGNAAKDLGKEYDMAGNAGLQVDSSALMEGLALTLVLNDNYIAGVGDEDQDYYNYLIKAVYSADPLTLGFGYQMHTQPKSVTDSAAKDMMAMWAGYKLSDALSFAFEYASRPNVDGILDAAAVKGSTAIRLGADYTADPLTVNGKVQINTGAYVNIAAGDVGTMSAWNAFQNGIAGTAIKVDASYKLTDAITASATLEDIMAGAVTGATGVKVADEALMSYKLSIADVLSEQLSVSGWFAGYNKMTEIGGNATYTFVAGLVGSLEVKTVTTEGVTDPANSYTAKIVATL